MLSPRQKELIWLLIFGWVLLLIAFIIIYAQEPSHPHARKATTRLFADAHPRMVNHFVTQDNISQNICVSGWTATVRPPVSYTSYLKTEELHFENNDQGVVSDYELDHRIPLELGGNPYRTENLWMEPHTKSEHSDPLENSLKRQVCAGTLTLNDARWKIYLYKASE